MQDDEPGDKYTSQEQRPTIDVEVSQLVLATEVSISPEGPIRSVELAGRGLRDMVSLANVG